MRYLLLFVLLFPQSLFGFTTVVNPDISYAVPAHEAGGQKHLARVGDTVIALINGGNALYRSTDSGENWTQIDSGGSGGGCLVQDEDYIYHFYGSSDDIMMVKFVADAATIPEPVSIYYDSDLGATNTGLYVSVTATVDSEGRIYIAFHHDNDESGSDSMNVLVSDTSVTSWTPHLVKQGSGGFAGENYTDPSIQVATDNTIYLSYSTFQDTPNLSRLSISTDHGVNWTDQAIATGGSVIYNTHVLPVGDNTVYIFAQWSGTQGLVFIKSTDSGSTWSSWTSIDSNPTSTNHYADPTAALASNGDIYVSYRSTSTEENPGSLYYNRIARSSDGGATWSFPFMFDGGNEMQVKSSLRYQTWFNCGGPVENVWMQDDGSRTPTYYHQEVGTTIASREVSSTPGYQDCGGDADSLEFPEMVPRLHDAYPNPFNPQTTLSFDLPGQEVVSLRVFDIAGRLVRSLMGREILAPGRHETTWNGLDDTGRHVGSGTYFYHLEGQCFSETKRMILIK